MKDHPSKDEHLLMANNQGNRYMGPQGVMYLVVKNPQRVKLLGEQISRLELEQGMSEDEEKHLEVGQENMCLINSLRVTRVPIDDNAKALYILEEEKELKFYLGHTQSLTH